MPQTVTEAGAGQPLVGFAAAATELLLVVPPPLLQAASPAAVARVSAARAAFDAADLLGWTRRLTFTMPPV